MAYQLSYGLYAIIQENVARSLEKLLVFIALFTTIEQLQLEYTDTHTQSALPVGVPKGCHGTPLSVYSYVAY